MSAIAFEKETLRNLAGPELFLQTGLEPLDGIGLEDVNGGSLLGGVVSAIGSAIGSAVGSALVSATVSAATGAPVSEVSSAAPLSSFAGSAAASGAVSLVESAYWAYNNLDF